MSIDYSNQSHSIGTDLIEPTWQSITAEDIMRLLEKYPQFNSFQEIIWHSPRPFSSAAIVKIDDGKIFIKRHASEIRDEEGLLEEHRVIRHLHKQGIPVSEIIVGVNNQSAFQIDEWTYEVHHLGHGVDLYKDAISWSPFTSENHAYSAGKMMAEMHNALEDFNEGKRKIRPLVSDFSIFLSEDPIEETEKFFVGRPGLEQYFQQREWKKDFSEILLPLHEQLKPFHYLFKPLWTHNDWHSSNLLWSDDSKEASVQTVLDFGLANQTFALYDLATALERNMVEWLFIKDEEHPVIHLQETIQFLKGYCEVKKLSKEEGQALVALLPIVHVDFALSEIDYFVRITKSSADAGIAYDDFLIDHALWFESVQGKQWTSAIKEFFAK